MGATTTAVDVNRGAAEAGIAVPYGAGGAGAAVVLYGTTGGPELYGTGTLTGTLDVSTAAGLLMALAGGGGGGGSGEGELVATGETTGAGDEVAAYDTGGGGAGDVDGETTAGVDGRGAAEVGAAIAVAVVLPPYDTGAWTWPVPSVSSVCSAGNSSTDRRRSAQQERHQDEHML